MRKYLYNTLLALAASSVAYAQENISATCAKRQLSGQPLAKVTVADPAEDDYDITHVLLDLRLNNSSTSVSGSVTTTAKVVASSLPAYVFELDAQYTIDSVLINNQPVSVSGSGDVHTASLPVALPQNAVFMAKVFYHGSATGTSTGLRNQTSPTWGTQVTFTMSEPYEAKGWWPVKQSLTDKIDSADIWLTVPANLKAGSNGLLKAVNVMPNSDWRYEWKTKYPIDYYLISASVANYTEYSYYAHFTGSNDSMLVQNYVYSNPQTLPFYKDQIDSVGLMIDYLSQLFGRYPFWKEKYGHCMVPIGGGMEHQTMTSLGDFPTTLTVHELGHQWFGDHVTCGSWQDIWLNEGFASYVEYLFAEHFWQPADAFAYMADKHNKVLSDDTSSVYVTDTTNVGRIFDEIFTYDKGASIVHTLRFVCNSDSLFFQGLRNYLSQFASGTALTADLKNVMQQTLGQNLDTFFNQWIYGKGHPVFAVTWNQVGNWVSVKLDQTTTDPSVPLFHTPVELQLFSGTGDTIVRVYNNQASQIFTFYWDRPMLSLFVDPNDWLLNELGNITQDTSLEIGSVAVPSVMVYPNPAKAAWRVRNLSQNTRLELHDLQGKLIWQANAGKEAEIPAASLTPGIYLLKTSNNHSTNTFKLLKE